MAYDAEFEREVLARALRDASYRAEARRTVDSSCFQSPEHAWLWKAIETRPSNEAPTPAIVATLASKDFPGKTNEDKRDEHIRTAISIFKLRPVAPKSALKELGDFARFNALNGAMQEAIKHLHYGRVDEAFTAMEKARGVDRKRRPYVGVRWIEEWDDRMERRKHKREHPELYVTIPTRLKRLDAAIQGIQATELGLVVGTTGRGKSIFGVHLAFWAALQGFTTVHVGMEMGAEQNATRFDSKFANFSYKRLKTFDLSSADVDDLKLRADRFRKRLLDKLYISSISIGGGDIRTIERIHSDRVAEGHRPQLFVVDSGDHLKAKTKMDNFRLEQSQAYWDMKGFAEEQELAVWSTTHAPKEVVNRVATAENVGESYDKSRIADIVVTLNQTAEQRRVDEMDAFLAKYRDGESGVIIPLETDFSRMHLAERIEGASEDEEEEKE